VARSLGVAIRGAMVTTRSGVAAVRVRVAAALRPGGAGAGAPAADQGDGAAVSVPPVSGAEQSSDPAPAVTPSPVTLTGRGTWCGACEESGFRGGLVRNELEESGGPRVTQGRQSTEGCPSRMEEGR
jgi:hypothetical protein